MSLILGPLSFAFCLGKDAFREQEIMSLVLVKNVDLLSGFRIS
jgi:hypothetical protein